MYACEQAVPYAQDELVLLVPSNHELAQRGSIDKCELYNLSFVSMNQGSSVQAMQEETLLRQGIKWHKLRTHMVCWKACRQGQWSTKPGTGTRYTSPVGCVDVVVLVMNL